MLSSDYRLVVEAFPAGHGDSFLIRCQSADRPRNILVDGGSSGTFEHHIRPTLEKLAAAGEQIDLLVVTHVDADHIEGVISLLAENGAAADPELIKIEEVWHNSYRHLSLPGREPTDSEKSRVRSQERSAAVSASESCQNISARQGSTVAALLKHHGYRWNAAFGGGPVLANADKAIELFDGVTLRLLSPTPETLDRLTYRWRRELLSMGVSHEALRCPDFETTFESALLASVYPEQQLEETEISSGFPLEPPDVTGFTEDKSETNGSSIAFHLEWHGLKVLFLGDAFPSVVATALRRLQQNQTQSGYSLVKLSHHGSQRSTSPELLDLLSADSVLISTNGQRHRHPDFETLLWVADRQAPGLRFLFNYPTPQSEEFASERFQQRFKHTVTVGEPGLTISFRLPPEDA